MTQRKEQELILQQANRELLLRGAIDRREFMKRTMMAGLGMAGIATVGKLNMGSAFAADRPLTPTFYQWIEDLHDVPMPVVTPYEEPAGSGRRDPSAVARCARSRRARSRCRRS